MGFACDWYRKNPELTWSGTPWNLRAAISAHLPVVDVGPRLDARLETLAKIAYVRRHAGSWFSDWPHSRLYDVVTERQVMRRATEAGVDVVVQTMDLAVTAQPYVLYQDLSHDVVLDRFRGADRVPEEFNRLSLQRLETGRERQTELYGKAAALVCMSRWLADNVVAHGVDPSRVFVVPPGVAHPAASPRPLDRPRTGRLILVGGDALRKGLASVLAALPLMREHWPEATLTVVGPRQWPGDGPPPAHVEYLGPRPPAEVAQLLTEHDLYVMPSQWEGFGITFAESLIAGLPCIGRNDCAMPEIIRAPQYGRVVGSRDDLDVPAAELAHAIDECLRDDALYARVGAAVTAARATYSWEHVGTRFRDIITGLV